LGDSLWLITGRRETGRAGMAFYVVARLVVRAKTINPPGCKYGDFHVASDLDHGIGHFAGARRFVRTILS
jgi:hypothetical protein